MQKMLNKNRDLNMLPSVLTRDIYSKLSLTMKVQERCSYTITDLFTILYHHFLLLFNFAQLHWEYQDACMRTGN